MSNTNDVYKILDENFPYDKAFNYDNSGIIFSLPDTVNKALVTLDITSEVIMEAIKEKANLIVSHHPLSLDKITSVSSDKASNKLLIALIKNNICAISAHTNLDVAKNGVNDVLATKLHIKKSKVFLDDEGIALGRVGVSEVTSLKDLFTIIKKELNVDVLKVIECRNDIKNIAVIGGSGSGFIRNAIKAGADTLITADCKHSAFLEAKELNFNLIDAGHYNTEKPVLDMLIKLLNNEFKTIDFIKSKANRDIVKYL
ncbi:MAG: Nif3-like dinuclear metal center hexameric protein [Clostridia bacterium]